jgi:hypothetical protein
MKPTGSMDGNLENTTTFLRTNFNQPIKLQGDYEVAIVEAIYTQSWYVNVGYIEYCYSEIITNKCWQKININFFDGENLKQFCERINNQVKEFIIEKIYNNRFLFIQTVKSLETEENVEKIKKLDLNLYPNSKYDKENKNNKLSVIDNIKKNEQEYIEAFSLSIIKGSLYVDFKNKKQSIKFIGDISKILKCVANNNPNLESHLFMPLTKLSHQINEYDTLNIEDPNFLLGTLFIYSDIGEYTYYGSQMMPILRTLVIDYKTTGRTLISHFDTPHYIRINKEEINSILIDIRDDQGEKIFFENSKITVKLHYRPVLND